MALDPQSSPLHHVVCRRGLRSLLHPGHDRTQLVVRLGLRGEQASREKSLPVKPGWHHKVAGSYLEKEILRIVAFWHPKANARRNGFRWLVLATEELIDRLPSIGKNGKPSVRSVRRAMAHLRDEGILTIEHHRHPFRQGMGKVYWLRPNEEGIGRVLAGNGHQTGTKLAQTNIQTTDEQVTDGQTHSGEPHEAQSTEASEVNSGEFLTKKKAGATLAAGMAVFEKEKKTAEDHPMVNTPEKAHKALRDACLASGFPNPGSFNKMRGGQMKTMLRRMKEEGIGPEEVGQLIFFVAGRWSEFIGWAKTKFNVTVPGTAPNHSALVMYAVEAVGFWTSYQAVPDVGQEVLSGGGGSNLDEEF